MFDTTEAYLGCIKQTNEKSRETGGKYVSLCCLKTIHNKINRGACS